VRSNAKEFSVTTITTGKYRENCHLVSDPVNKETAVIDPGSDAPAIWKTIKDQGLQVKLILCTHAHFDHIGAVEFLKNKTGAPFHLHKSDARLLRQAPLYSHTFHAGPIDVSSVDKFINSSSKLSFSRFDIQVLETPGHTPGGVSFLIESMLFPGDTLLKCIEGLSKLPGANSGDLKNSIDNILLRLPAETIVHHGHGSATTIAAERLSRVKNRSGKTSE